MEEGIRKTRLHRGDEGLRRGETESDRDSGNGVWRNLNGFGCFLTLWPLLYRGNMVHNLCVLCHTSHKEEVNQGVVCHPGMVILNDGCRLNQHGYSYWLS